MRFEFVDMAECAALKISYPLGLIDQQLRSNFKLCTLKQIFESEFTGSESFPEFESSKTD